MTLHGHCTFNKLSKEVSLVDIGVTIATQRRRHAFYIFPIFSTSRPKLLKQPYVPSRPHVGLPDWKGLKWYHNQK